MEAFVWGPVTVYPFGLAVALLALGALLWTGARLGWGESASWFAVLSLPLALVGARLGYCLMVVDQLLGDEDFGFLFRLTEGGYMLWGAVGGALLAAWLTGRLAHRSFAEIADAAVLPAALLIALGRLAAGLLCKDQGIGFELAAWFDPEETDFASRYSLFALSDWSFFERLPFAVQNYYEEWCWAIFVPEALWAAAAGILADFTSARPGGRIGRFLVLYSAGQILLEGMLRGEVLHLPWLGFVRANQIVCALVLLLLWFRWRRAVPAKTGWIALALLFLGAGIVIAMEFAAFEKKISLIESFPADVCHLIMGLGCLLMGLSLRPLWRGRFLEREGV